MRLVLPLFALFLFHAAESRTAPLPEQAFHQVGDLYYVHGRAVAFKPIHAFYRSRNYEPVWTGSDGGLNERGRQLVARFQTAAADGLNPSVYILSSGGTQFAQEVAVASTLLRFAADLHAGRKSPSQIDPSLFVSRPAPDALQVLHGASATADLEKFIDSLAPSAPAYQALRRSLGEYRNFLRDGSLPAVRSPMAIKPGYTGPDVAAIWERLRRTGDIDKGFSLPGSYDNGLTNGVIAFQRRHGLTADGVIGTQTRAAMNVSIRHRIRQIEMNMERWRWMPGDLGEKHVFVNIAAFELYAVQDRMTVITMPVIVGKPFRRTPVFSDLISYLEINPDWTVPVKIAVEDLLPKIKADPAYLKTGGFDVLARDGTIPPPETIEWSRYGRKNFPFVLRQRPGPANALGRIKFMFPNSFAIYLHDTPDHSLFARGVRTFSSGCIRVSDPSALARFLMQDDPDWTIDKLKAEIEKGETKRVSLKKKVPVHLSYLTAWVSEDGTMQFRDDIYGRDATLFSAFYNDLTD